MRLSITILCGLMVSPEVAQRKMQTELDRWKSSDQVQQINDLDFSLIFYAGFWEGRDLGYSEGLADGIIGGGK